MGKISTTTLYPLEGPVKDPLLKDGEREKAQEAMEVDLGPLNPSPGSQLYLPPTTTSFFLPIVGIGADLLPSIIS